MKFPLDTLACTIDASGITAPSFVEIMQSLVASVRGIFGPDIYIEPDSQDYQLLAAYAQAMHDGNQTAIAVYNGFSPSRAVGSQLSSLVKINGLRRNVPSNSTVIVNVAGDVGTQILNGVIEDTNGVKWNLPASVLIPPSGLVSVTATAQTAGSVVAKSGTVTKISTPVRGWASVTNPVDATPGQPVESDAKLRRRQAISTAYPAQTPVEAIKAAVANVAGVGRYQVYENDTSVTDANGIPGHSIAVVAEGGDANLIASAVARKKPPGTGTYGTTAVIVTDTYGMPSTIRYFSLREVGIITTIEIAPLTGYVSTTAQLITSAVSAWFSTFQIGHDSYLDKLFAVVNLSGDAATSTSGLRQFQLDTIGSTYHIPVTNLWQGRSDMLATGAAAPIGRGYITVSSTAGMVNGRGILVRNPDGSQYKGTILSMNGLSVSVSPLLNVAIQPGAQIMVNNDLPIAFNEGTQPGALYINT